MLTVQEQLQARALRILHDEQRHADSAIAWAIRTLTPVQRQKAQILRDELMRQSPFTVEELALSVMTQGALE